MNCNDCGGFLPGGCECSPFGGRHLNQPAPMSEVERLAREYGWACYQGKPAKVLDEKLQALLNATVTGVLASGASDASAPQAGRKRMSDELKCTPI